MLICLAGAELGPRTQAARNIGHPIPFDAWDCTRPTRTIVTKRSSQCQGQDARINGKFVKDIVAEREVQLLVEEEEFAAVGEEIEALTSRTKLA